MVPFFQLLSLPLLLNIAGIRRWWNYSLSVNFSDGFNWDTAALLCFAKYFYWSWMFSIHFSLNNFRIVSSCFLFFNSFCQLVCRFIICHNRFIFSHIARSNVPYSGLFVTVFLVLFCPVIQPFFYIILKGRKLLSLFLQRLCHCYVLIN